MRRADRLFQIIQVLRQARRPMTAAALAEAIEVSRRTIYRDVTDLIAQRVPITGEAGVGYVLESSYDMPPLMLTPDEIEAIVLGSQWVTSHADKMMANAAKDVLGKIIAVIPEHLRPHIAEPSVGTKRVVRPEPDVIDLRELRRAIREGRKARLLYYADSGVASERVVWPVILGYDETRRMLIAWCELRKDFRHFRTDRIETLDVLDEGYGVEREVLRKRWEKARDGHWPEKPVAAAPRRSTSRK
jgi:predicted DNA-binding transcriptional regulator YafY